MDVEQKCNTVSRYHYLSRRDQVVSASCVNVVYMLVLHLFSCQAVIYWEWATLKIEQNDSVQAVSRGSTLVSVRFPTRASFNDIHSWLLNAGFCKTQQDPGQTHTDLCLAPQSDHNLKVPLSIEWLQESAYSFMLIEVNVFIQMNFVE